MAGVAIGLTGSVGELLDEVALRLRRGLPAGQAQGAAGVGRGAGPAPSGSVGRPWCCSPTPMAPTGTCPWTRPLSSWPVWTVTGSSCLEQPLGDDDLAGPRRLARRCAPRCAWTRPCPRPPPSSRPVGPAPARWSISRPGAWGATWKRYGPRPLRASKKCRCGAAGMVETGIARAANLALASLPGFSLPGDLSATGRFFATDLAGPMALGPTGP